MTAFRKSLEIPNSSLRPAPSYLSSPASLPEILYVPALTSAVRILMSVTSRSRFFNSAVNISTADTIFFTSKSGPVLINPLTAFPSVSKWAVQVPSSGVLNVISVPAVPSSDFLNESLTLVSSPSISTGTKYSSLPSSAAFTATESCLFICYIALTSITESAPMVISSVTALNSSRISL